MNKSPNSAVLKRDLLYNLVFKLERINDILNELSKYLFNFKAAKRPVLIKSYGKHFFRYSSACYFGYHYPWYGLVIRICRYKKDIFISQGFNYRPLLSDVDSARYCFYNCNIQ